MKFRTRGSEILYSLKKCYRNVQIEGGNNSERKASPA